MEQRRRTADKVAPETLQLGGEGGIGGHPSDPYLH